MSTEVDSHRLTAGTQPWQARLPFFYGWVVVAISLVISFFSVGLMWAGAVFVVPMQQELGWSRTGIYLAFAVRGWIGLVLIPLFGSLTDRERGAVVLAVITGTVASLGLALIGAATEEWQFVLLFGVLGGIGMCGQAFPVSSVIVPKWFIRKRANAMGWAGLGSPLGALAMTPALAILIETAGWRAAWVVLGLLSFLLTVLPSLLLSRQPEDVGLPPDGEPIRQSSRKERRPAPVEPTATAGEVMRLRTFWLLVIAVSVGSLSINGLPASLFPMYIDRGFPNELAVWAVSLYGLFSMAGRFMWAYFVGRSDIRAVLIAIGLSGAVVSPLLLVLPGETALLFAALNGLVIGGFVTLSPMVWPEFYGRMHLGAISGLARPLTIIVHSGGPLLMALIVDRTGSYDLSLWLLALSWVLCAGTLWVARPSGPVLRSPL